MDCYQYLANNCYVILFKELCIEFFEYSFFVNLKLTQRLKLRSALHSFTLWVTIRLSFSMERIRIWSDLDKRKLDFRLSKVREGGADLQEAAAPKHSQATRDNTGRTFSLPGFWLVSLVSKRVDQEKKDKKVSFN